MGYYQWIFEAVEVTDLPPFHNAFKCHHSARFRTMSEEAKRCGSLRDVRDEQEIGRKFLGTLSAADLASCGYHQADWGSVASESVRIIRESSRQDERIYKNAARNSGLVSNDRSWLISLFEHPIRIEGGSYSDGQHRVCALRFSGATHVAAVVRAEWVESR